MLFSNTLTQVKNVHKLSPRQQKSMNNSESKRTTAFEAFSQLRKAESELNKTEEEIESEHDLFQDCDKARQNLIKQFQLASDVSFIHYSVVTTFRQEDNC